MFLRCASGCAHRDELKQAESDAAEAQMELAEEALALTTEKSSLGVNSELLNHARWKAERLAKESSARQDPWCRPWRRCIWSWSLAQPALSRRPRLQKSSSTSPIQLFTETQQPASAVPVFLPILDLSGNTAVPQQDGTS